MFRGYTNLRNVHDAREHAVHMQRRFREYCKNANVEEIAVNAAIDDVVAAMTNAENRIKAECKAWEDKFAVDLIVQAVICWRDRRKKIVVCHPNDWIHDPHLHESVLEHIRNEWGVPANEAITTSEDYDIAIVADRRQLVRWIYSNRK